MMRESEFRGCGSNGLSCTKSSRSALTLHKIAAFRVRVACTLISFVFSFHSTNKSGLWSALLLRDLTEMA